MANEPISFLAPSGIAIGILGISLILAMMIVKLRDPTAELFAIPGYQWDDSALEQGREPPPPPYYTPEKKAEINAMNEKARTGQSLDQENALNGKSEETTAMDEVKARSNDEEEENAND